MPWHRTDQSVGGYHTSGLGQGSLLSRRRYSEIDRFIDKKIVGQIVRKIGVREKILEYLGITYT